MWRAMKSTWQWGHRAKNWLIHVNASPPPQAPLHARRGLALDLCLQANYLRFTNHCLSFGSSISQMHAD